MKIRPFPICLLLALSAPAVILGEPPKGSASLQPGLKELIDRPERPKSKLPKLEDANPEFGGSAEQGWYWVTPEAIRKIYPHVAGTQEGDDGWKAPIGSAESKTYKRLLSSLEGLSYRIGVFPKVPDDFRTAASVEDAHAFLEGAVDQMEQALIVFRDLERAERTLEEIHQTCDRLKSLIGLNKMFLASLKRIPEGSRRDKWQMYYLLRRERLPIEQLPDLLKGLKGLAADGLSKKAHAVGYWNVLAWRRDHETLNQYVTLGERTSFPTKCNPAGTDRPRYLEASEAPLSDDASIDQLLRGYDECLLSLGKLGAAAKSPSILSELHDAEGVVRSHAAYLHPHLEWQLSREEKISTKKKGKLEASNSKVSAIKKKISDAQLKIETASASLAKIAEAQGGFRKKILDCDAVIKKANENLFKVSSEEAKLRDAGLPAKVSSNDELTKVYDRMNSLRKLQGRRRDLLASNDQARSERRDALNGLALSIRNDQRLGLERADLQDQLVALRRDLIRREEEFGRDKGAFDAADALRQETVDWIESTQVVKEG